jgi:iron complex outermembrane receptor protein
VSYLYTSIAPFAFNDPFFADHIINLAGHHLPHAPEWKANLGAQYTLGLGAAGDLTLRGDVAYTDAYFDEVTNAQMELQLPGGGILPLHGTRQPAYVIGDARLIWAPTGGKYQAQLFVQNIGNTIYMYDVSAAPSAGGFVGNPSAPRTFGVKFSIAY